MPELVKQMLSTRHAPHLQHIGSAHITQEDAQSQPHCSSVTLSLACHMFCYWSTEWLSRSAVLHRKAKEVAFTPFVLLPCVTASAPLLQSVLCSSTSVYIVACISQFLPDIVPHMQVPVYAHVKEVVDPQGKLEAVEINYMKFLAFNGSYKVCAILCCAVMRCAMLCRAMLYCAMSCCAVLCCAVLCCAVLCCVMLCHAVLCCAMLRYSMLCLQCCILDCMMVTDLAHMPSQGAQPDAMANVSTSACRVMMCSCLTGSTLGRWELMMGIGSMSPSGSPQMLGRCWASTTAHTGTCQQLSAKPWQKFWQKF